jgi:ketosteroid isomerase-like protein
MHSIPDADGTAAHASLQIAKSDAASTLKESFVMNCIRSVASALCAVSLLASGTAAADRSVITDPSLRAFLEEFEEANRRFMNGDSAPFMQHLSRRDDVAIIGGWGAYEKGWPATKARYEWAGARFRGNQAKLTVEYLTSDASGDLAFTTAIERSEVKVEGQERAAPMALRVTHIFRREDGAW